MQSATQLQSFDVWRLSAALGRQCFEPLEILGCRGNLVGCPVSKCRCCGLTSATTPTADGYRKIRGSSSLENRQSKLRYPSFGLSPFSVLFEPTSVTLSVIMTWASARLVVALLFVCAQRIRAQDDNPISRPQGGETITAGTEYNITWTPTRGNIVSIEIWNEISLASSFNGINCHYDDYNVDCSLLIENITNSGSYLWHVPANAPVANNYFLDIFVPDAGFDGPFYFMTNNFSISNIGSPTTTASTSTPTATGTGSPSYHPGNFPGINRKTNIADVY